MNPRGRAIEPLELRSVLETLPFYITCIDRQGTVEYINRTYPGVTVDQVVGTNLLNWLEPAHREPMQRAWERVLAGEEPVEVIVVGSGEHGIAWYRSRLHPIRRRDEIVGVTIAGEDITHLKRAEERASQVSRVEAIGRVAGAIAHDFNNMLAVMLSELEVLELELPPGASAGRATLSQLRQTVSGATDLTRGLVDAVRQKQTSAGQLELVAGVSELETMLKLAGGRSLEVSCVHPVERAVVDLERHELQQVLVNLVVNAREAGASHVEVRVETEEIGARSRSWLAPGSYARLTVKDDGPGIPEAIRARVLEPFVTTKESGTGLGLATCFALANARGGSLEVTCPVEGGTTVTILLPLRDGSTLASPRPHAGAEVPVPSTQLTILVVDDHDSVRVSIARYLTRLGHRVLEARDGLDAIEVMERHAERVDAVVTDLLMPRCDGLELTRRLGAASPALPVIVMSGFCTPEQQAELEALGATFIAKPVAPSRLLQELQRRHLSAAASTPAS